MSDVFTTPCQAVSAMVAAGAVFETRRRDDNLGISFTYQVADGGDLMQCRRILASAKSEPAQFFEAFKAEVAARSAEA